MIFAAAVMSGRMKGSTAVSVVGLLAVSVIFCSEMKSDNVPPVGLVVSVMPLHLSSGGTALAAPKIATTNATVAAIRITTRNKPR